MIQTALTILTVLLLLIGAGTVLDVPFKQKTVTMNTAMANPQPLSCKVDMVFDGDTFRCDLNGNGRAEEEWEKIRLLGIDTPEMHYSKKNTAAQDEPFAEAASQYARNLLEHRTVYLEYDQQKLDHYGRTLAYVYLDRDQKQMANRLMVQEGLAKVLFIPPNLRYEPQFQQDQQKARQQKRGMWQ